MARAFRKILIANRGEIALRVIRTARRLGYPTVAIYSEADAEALHVKAADEAVLVGSPAPAESYLAIAKILAAAGATGADAVHPGYGFVAESASFARACAEAGITFIGPPAGAIELMGDKRASKKRMREAGVPCIPGYDGDDQTPATLAAQAERIGFPVMIKASAGGGGRGMRLVTAADAVPEALRSARSEAESAFGDGTLLLERAISGARHVEIQVLGDTQGNVIHLGERDCSVQRRHQKVIEESPSPAVDDALRARMGEAAVEAARACGYVGAGTVELLLDREGSFYFMEMNTRLQVEHPVTELVTGVDLVEQQIRIARGEALALEVSLTGHAIEARLYAEDTTRGFLPQTGRVSRWRAPSEARVDGAVSEGLVISPHYDPMIAKIIAHGATRDEARRRLIRALSETCVLGVTTNKAMLKAVCEHPVFAAGDADTHFVGEHLVDHPCLRATEPDRLTIAAAAVVSFLEGARGLVEDGSWIGWRSGGPIWSTIDLASGDHRWTVQVRAQRPRVYSVTFADQMRLELGVMSDEGGALAIRHDGVRRSLDYAVIDDEIWLDFGSGAVVFSNTTYAPPRAADAAGSGRLSAPLDGRVTEVSVKVGDSLARGQLVMVLEAMKMEHRIVADVDGTLRALHVNVGNQVKTRQLLAEIE